MAVKIRLSRTGKTNRPFCRLVAADSRKKRDGAILANIGAFDPITSTVTQFHDDLYQYFVSKGAIVTDSAKKVYKLYKKVGIASNATTNNVIAEQSDLTVEKKSEKTEVAADSEVA